VIAAPGGDAGAGDGRGGADPSGADAPGGAIVRASWAGTATFAIAASAAAIAPDPLAAPVAVLDGVLFAVGCAAFLAAYARAVSRSREEVLSVAGVYLLAGTAPRAVQVRLLGALGVQVAVAVVTASVRLYTSLAFGILVPVFGLGLAGLWAARHGRFAPRPPEPAARPPRPPRAGRHGQAGR
jgi:hypothetical protein